MDVEQFLGNILRTAAGVRQVPVDAPEEEEHEPPAEEQVGGGK